MPEEHLTTFFYVTTAGDGLIDAPSESIRAKYSLVYIREATTTDLNYVRQTRRPQRR